MSDALKQIWEKVDQMIGPQRMETEAEHIARDMREGRFPKRSDPIQVPVAGPAAARHLAPGDDLAEAGKVLEPLRKLADDMDRHATDEWDESELICKTGDLIRALLARIAALTAERDEARADRDKWFEGAGAHHVASMKQAQRADQAEAKCAHLRATVAEVTLDRDAQNHRADNHWETLRSIREIAESSGDLARISQWVNDAGSGYNETAETTLSAEMDRRIAVETEAATLRDRLARMEGAWERVGIGGNHLATWLPEPCPPVETEPLVALEQIGAGIHYDVWCCWRAIMQSRAALTDGGSNG